MRLRSTILVLLLLAAALAGCGGASADRKAMDDKFQQLEYEITTLQTVTSAYNQAHFEEATQKYIALVRRYADELGPEEARRRLQSEGDTLRPYCLPCVATLEDEAKRY
jgi:hypothetical protein